MGLVLSLITIIMFIITYRYNNMDWFDNPFADTLVQILHVSILGFIFYILISNNYIFVTIFCGYVLLKNIKWLLLGTDDEEDKENKENIDKENDKER